jgi:hypothetical protein
MDGPVADAIEVIQATLAPSFLISGTSIFLNFTQTRLFRVVDRIRAVGAGATNDTPNASRPASRCFATPSPSASSPSRSPS